MSYAILGTTGRLAVVKVSANTDKFWDINLIWFQIMPYKNLQDDSTQI